MPPHFHVLAGLRESRSMPIGTRGFYRHDTEGYPMTTSWKIFAAVLVVAVVAAMVMGSSHANHAPVAATTAVPSAEFPKGPTGTLTAPPVDKVPPPSTDPAPAKSSMTWTSTTSSFGSTSSSPSPSGASD